MLFRDETTSEAISDVNSDASISTQTVETYEHVESESDEFGSQEGRSQDEESLVDLKSPILKSLFCSEYDTLYFPHEGENGFSLLT